MVERNNYSKKKGSKTKKVEDDYAKVPPQAIGIEDNVLCALMIDSNSYSQVGEMLTPEVFYAPAHQKIYQSIATLAQNEKPIDFYTVTEQLRKDGCLEEVGGEVAIMDLTTKVTSSAHLVYHAEILVNKFTARELIQVSSQIATKSYQEEDDVQDILQDAETQIFNISQKNMKRDVVQISPVVDDAIERINAAAKVGSGMTGVTSGYSKLDKETRGWQGSDLIIIAARPAMGKTAFVISMCKNMAVDHGIPCAIFSLEMARVQLVNRLISNVCQIPGDNIKSGLLTNEEWQRLDSSIDGLRNAPIYIDDTSALSVLEFRTKARKLVAEHDVKIMVIDYLQLMNARGMSFFSREQEVSTISRSLKGIAKELNIPIIALSQLNRSVEQRESKQGMAAKRPQLSDLRESGAIEQDADMVCFIHRPDYYKIYMDQETGMDLRGVAQIIIAKHRNGATGDVSLYFSQDYVTFLNEAPLANSPFQNHHVVKAQSKAKGTGGNTSSQPGTPYQDPYANMPEAQGSGPNSFPNSEHNYDPNESPFDDSDLSGGETFNYPRQDNRVDDTAF